MSRTLQFSLFFGTILVILGLMQWYLLASYRRWARTLWPESVRAFLIPLWFILAAGNLLLILSFFARHTTAEYTPFLRDLIVYPAGMFFAATVFGFLLLAVKDLSRIPFVWGVRVSKLLARLGRADSTTISARIPELSDGRRSFLKLAGSATIGVIAATPVLASLATARDYQVRRIPLYFPNLPSELEGFTIAQVSDLHSGIYMSEGDMRQIFEIVNGLGAQVTVVTGDLVDTSDEEIPPLHEALRSLKAERGVYAILGNHDHFATGDKVAAATREAGLTVLRNAHETLDVDGARLSLIGIDDCSPRRNYADLGRAIGGLDPESFKVMLVHQPRFWPEAKKANMDLTLVGHTHGGQVGFEAFGLKLYPVYLAYDHPMGHFIEEGKQLYVNVGVGMVRTPIRLVRPEIDLFEFQRGLPRLFTADVS